MVELSAETSQQQLRTKLLSAVKALKSHVKDIDKYAAGVSLKKVELLPSNIKITVPNSKPDLSAIRADMADCQLCALGKTRKNLVFGDGNSQAKIVFVV